MIETLGIKGIGSEGVIAITLYLIFRELIWPWIQRRRNPELKSNPNDKPGKAQECLKHMSSLAVIENQLKNNDKEHGEIKQSIRKIYNILNGMRK